MVNGKARELMISRQRRKAFFLCPKDQMQINDDVTACSRVDFLLSLVIEYILTFKRIVLYMHD